MRMKDYLMFLEEKGIVEFDEHNSAWTALTGETWEDLYTPDLLDEYNGQLRFSFMTEDTPTTNED